MINVYSPISNLGYGVHGSNIIKALCEKKIDINLTPIGQIQSNPWFERYWKPATEKLFDRNSPSIFIFHSNYSNQMTGSVTASFAVFETTKLMPEELHHLKNTVDKVFTTTAKHKEILVANNVPKDKIYVVREGCDPTVYNAKKRTPLIKTDKFCFFTGGKLEKRKNTDLIIRSFIDTMTYKECALICHTYNPFLQGKNKNPWTNLDLSKYGFSVKEDVETHVLLSNSMCDIYLTKPGLDILKMPSLYSSANVGISYSHAEGWDLVLNEMLACGIPCIASNIIGHSEYLSGCPRIQQELVVEPLGTEPAQDGIWFVGDRGEWSKLSKDDLCDAIETVYDNRTRYERPNYELSEYYHANFNWSLAVDALLKAINS